MTFDSARHRTKTKQLIQNRTTCCSIMKPLDPVFSHLPPESRAGNPERLGRPGRVPGEAHQDAADMLRLELREGHRFGVGKSIPFTEQRHLLLAKGRGKVEVDG